jgi:hypothetical protein
MLTLVGSCLPGTSSLTNFACLSVTQTKKFHKIDTLVSKLKTFFFFVTEEETKYAATPSSLIQYLWGKLGAVFTTLHFLVNL